MNYLRSFLEEKRRAETSLSLTDKTDKTPFVGSVSWSLARSSTHVPPNQSPQAASAHESAGLPDANRDAHLRAEAQEDLRPAWTRTLTPDSRHPLIPPEVRAKIEAIETEARRLCWPPELLWNCGFWDCPRGLAAVLDPGDEIAEVTSNYISILKTKRNPLRFRRHAA